MGRIGNHFRKSSDNEKLKNHFNGPAYEFDSIYENRGLVTKIINKLFRRDMLERIPFSIRELSPLHGKTVLDIGCGSGRASILLAKEGARVTGIDCAERMIELAKKYQHRESTIDNIEFMCCDFMNEFTDDHKYDYCIVLGYSIISKIHGHF